MLLKSVRPFNPEAPHIEPHIEPHPVHPAPHHPHPAPHHGHIAPPPPHHHGPRHNMVSVLYNTDKLMEIYGDSWSFHIEKIAGEPPEMKILFALEMGFKIAVNPQIMDSIVFGLRSEPAYKFANPALDDDIIALLSEKLGVEGDTLSTVLEHTPDGVVAVIIASAKK